MATASGVYGTDVSYFRAVISSLPLVGAPLFVYNFFTAPSIKIDESLKLASFGKQLKEVQTKIKAQEPIDTFAKITLVQDLKKDSHHLIGQLYEQTGKAVNEIKENILTSRKYIVINSCLLISGIIAITGCAVAARIMPPAYKFIPLILLGGSSCLVSSISICLWKYTKKKLEHSSERLSISYNVLPLHKQILGLGIFLETIETADTGARLAFAKRLEAINQKTQLNGQHKKLSEAERQGIQGDIDGVQGEIYEFKRLNS